MLATRIFDKPSTQRLWFSYSAQRNEDDMASDSRKKPGRSFASTARAAAVTRFLQKAFDIKTLKEGQRGLDGVRVHQDPFAAEVSVRVSLGDEDEAARWSSEIEDSLAAHGYQVNRTGTDTVYTSRDEWKLDDLITRRLALTGRPAMESDAGMIAATDEEVARLRGFGWVDGQTRELTEQGQIVRSRLAAQKKTAAQTEKRRLRERGW